MGTISERPRKDGTTAYDAQILIKRKGKIIHREAETFDRQQGAKAWLARRETELAQPGALERGPDPKLHEAIDRYTGETENEIGHTKTQVLRTIKKRDGLRTSRYFVNGGLRGSGGPFLRPYARQAVLQPPKASQKTRPLRVRPSLRQKGDKT